MNNNALLMQGKRGLILGLANDKSIAWGIAQQLYQHGASLGITYQNDALLKRVKPLSEQCEASFLVHCDVSDDESIHKLKETVMSHWGKIDFLVHAVAFSDKDELKGGYIHTSRQNFLNTMDISCYSLTSLCQILHDVMNKNASIISLSYFGAEKVMPHYNVMGLAKSALETSIQYLAVDLGKDNIRINGISAGPIKTLAASGISDFKVIMKWNEYNSPLRRNVSIQEVGQTALYLLSDLSKAVTAEIVHVDSGYNIMGMRHFDNQVKSNELLANAGIDI